MGTGQVATYKPGRVVDGITATWLLSTVTDIRQNRADYEYDCGGGSGVACLPRSVAYGRQNYKYRVDLAFERRPDVVTAAIAGAYTTLDRRLRSVTVKTPDRTIRTYELKYADRDDRSILISVEESAPKAKTPDRDRIARPPTTFDTGIWGPWWRFRFDQSWPFTPLGYEPASPNLEVSERIPWVNSQPFWFQTPFLNVADINGDGRGDWSQIQRMGSTTASQTYTIRARIMRPDHAPIHHEQQFSTPRQQYCTEWAQRQSLTADTCEIITSAYLADFTGDALIDYVLLTSRLRVLRLAWDPNLNKFADPENLGFITQDDAQAPHLVGLPECQPADVDGDGLADLVCLHRNTDSQPRIGIGTSMGQHSIQWTWATGPSGIDGTVGHLRMVDINRDSLPDPVILAVIDDTVKGIPIFVGHIDKIRVGQAIDLHLPVSPVGEIFTGDFNGDNRADFGSAERRKPSDRTPSVVNLALATPTGEYTLKSQEVSIAILELAVADAEGDGITDLMVSARESPHLGDGCSPGVDIDHPILLTLRSDANATLHTPGACGVEHLPIEEVDSSKWPASGESLFANARLDTPDLNGDGRADYLYSSSFLRESVLSSSRASYPRDWIAGDFNGDGRPDYGLAERIKRDGIAGQGYRLTTALMKPTGEYQTASQQVGTNQGIVANESYDTAQWFFIDTLAADTPTATSARPVADGRSDAILLADTPGGVTLHSLTWNANGAMVSRTWHSDVSAGPGGPNDWHAADLNADGGSDLFRLSTLKGQLTIDALISRGDGTWSDQRTTLAPEAGESAGSLESTRILDINGDGRADVTMLHDNKLVSWISGLAGLSFLGPHVTRLEEPHCSPRQWRPASLDHDGLVDLLCFRSSTDSESSSSVSTEGLHSLGNGTWHEEGRTTELPQPVQADWTKWHSTDVNGDGLTDLVSPSDPTAGENGLSHVDVAALIAKSDSSWRFDVWREIPIRLKRSPIFWKLGDAWADGGAGFISFHGDASSIALASVDMSWKGDDLQRVHNGMGHDWSVEYGIAYGRRTAVPVSLSARVVRSIKLTTGENETKTTYDHEHAIWSAEHRRLLGFESSAALDETSERHLRRMVTDCGLLAQSEAYIDRHTGQTVRAVAHEYVETRHGTLRGCQESETRRWNCEAGRCPGQSISYRYDNNSRPILAVVEQGDRSQSRVETSWSYADQPKPYFAMILTGESNEEVSNGPHRSRTVLSRFRYLYEGQMILSDPISNLEVTRSEAWDSSRSRWISTTVERDDQGRVASVLDPTGDGTHRRTRFEYVGENSLPSSQCDVTGCSRVEYEPGLDLVTSVTDVNDRQRRYEFDSLGRLRGVTDVGGVATTLEYLDTGDAAHQRIKITTADSWTEYRFDGLGRIIRASRDDGATTQLFYSDASDQPSEASGWHLENQSPKWTRYSRDGLGRLLSVSRPDGTVWTYSHGPNDSRSESPDGAVTEAHYDAAERLTGLSQYVRCVPGACSSGSQAADKVDTSYAWDGAGRVTAIVDDAGNRDVFDYDSLSRVTNTCLMDIGCMAFTYHDDGTLHTRTDAKGQVETVEVDAEGRIRSRQASVDGTTSSLVRFTYGEELSNGSHPYSRGELVEASDAVTDARSMYTYERHGLAQETSCSSDGCFSYGYVYYPDGSLADLSYPDQNGSLNMGGPKIHYSYDSRGRLTAIDGLIQRIDYSLNGAPALVKRDDGIEEAWTYEEDSGLLSQHRVVDADNKTIASVQSTYDKSGILIAEERTGTYGTDRITFRNDDLGRLLHYEVLGSGRQETYRYDSIGNMIERSGVGVMAYDDPQRPHAVTSIGRRQLVYDANGNLQRDGDLVFEWNDRNQLVRIIDYGQAGARGLMNSYNFAGIRISSQKVSQAIRTHWGHAVALAGNLPEYAISLPFGGSVEMLGDSRVKYIDDATGTTLVRIDPSGDIQTPQWLGPYGSGDASLSRQHFGGYVVESGERFVFTGGRYYDRELGRFLSPDPLISDPIHSQSWNRYGYARNAPMMRGDPTGFQDIGLCRRYDGAPCENSQTSDEAYWGAVGLGSAGDLIEGVGQKIGDWIGDLLFPNQEAPAPAPLPRRPPPPNFNSGSFAGLPISPSRGGDQDRAAPQGGGMSRQDIWNQVLGQPVDSVHISHFRPDNPVFAAVRDAKPLYDAATAVAAVSIGGVGAASIAGGGTLTALQAAYVRTGGWLYVKFPTLARLASGGSVIGGSRLVGNAFQRYSADAFRRAGFEVEEQVRYVTPAGVRVMDLVIKYNGRIVQLAELKYGAGRYGWLQELKDSWIYRYEGRWVDVVRSRDMGAPR